MEYFCQKRKDAVEEQEKYINYSIQGESNKTVKLFRLTQKKLW